MSLVTVLKCMPAGDPNGFTGSEDPGAGCAVRSVASAATREAMLNALARGDSGPRASIGARRPGRRRLRLHAPGPTEAGPAHGPGAGARGATHCRGPVPRGHGVTAPHPRPRGPWWVESPGGWCGPSCISSSPALRLSSQGPLWPAPPDLLRLPKAWPPSVQRSHQLPPPGGEAAAGGPSPRPRRGAPAGPCPVLLPPPQLPLNLGVERTVQAPAAATGGRPQGCRVVLSSVPRDRTWPRERLPGPCGRLTVAPGDPEPRDTAQAA